MQFFNKGRRILEKSLQTLILLLLTRFNFCNVFLATLFFSSKVILILMFSIMFLLFFLVSNYVRLSLNSKLKNRHYFVWTQYLWQHALTTLFATEENSAKQSICVRPNSSNNVKYVGSKDTWTMLMWSKTQFSSNWHFIQSCISFAKWYKFKWHLSFVSNFSFISIIGGLSALL